MEEGEKSGCINDTISKLMNKQANNERYETEYLSS